MSRSDSAADVIVGGCFCGSIRYEFDVGDYKVGNCHCTMCRRCHAAPFVTWLVVPADRFRLVKGQPKRLDSSSHAHRDFCDQCGSHMTCEASEHPGIVDVSLGSLDVPDDFEPKGGIYTDTKLHWVNHV